MRIMGHPYHDIGQALGVTPRAAYKMVLKELDRIRTQTEEDFRTLRDLEATPSMPAVRRC